MLRYLYAALFLCKLEKVLLTCCSSSIPDGSLLTSRKGTFIYHDDPWFPWFLLCTDSDVEFLLCLLPIGFLTALMPSSALQVLNSTRSFLRDWHRVCLGVVGVMNHLNWTEMQTMTTLRPCFRSDRMLTLTMQPTFLCCCTSFQSDCEKLLKLLRSDSRGACESRKETLLECSLACSQHQIYDVEGCCQRHQDSMP